MTKYDMTDNTWGFLLRDVQKLQWQTCTSLHFLHNFGFPYIILPICCIIELSLIRRPADFLWQGAHE